MQSTPSMQSLKPSRRGMLVLTSLSTLYHYMFCMMVSSTFSLWPVFGGALYLSARTGTLLVRNLFGRKRPYLSRGIRITGICLLCLMLVADALLLAVYPAMLSTYAMWIIFTLVLLITMRGTLAHRLVGKIMRQSISKGAFVWLMAVLEAVPLALSAVLLFTYMPVTQAWQTFGCFALGALLEGQGLWRERAQIATEDLPAKAGRAAVKHISGELNSLGAYHAYERLHMLILMALQVTLVMMYTFIGLTGDELFTCLLIAMGLTLLLPILTEWLLRALENQRPAATQLLLFGLVLWIYGLVLFYRQLDRTPHLMMSYLSLGLSVGGLTISTTCIAELERQMINVARYGLHNQLDGYAQMRMERSEMATLVGQMIALVLLTVLCFPSEFSLEEENLARLADGFKPLMIVPLLLLLASAFVSVLHFPLNNRYFAKLRRFLTLQDDGGENPALEKQLENVVVKRHKNRFGIRLIITLLRPLYYHKVLGKENVAGYEDGRMILVCNHGEIYGPIVANLYIPISFRPWVLAHMMDRESIVEHMYQGTMLRQKWIPEKWKKPIIRMVCPLLQWVFESLDAIPVYRGNPRALMKTFRLTIEAMQAGDNILLFPENGEGKEVGEKGFAQEGVGELYTGFAMLAPAYYAKTGKRAVFVPIYASKKLRTLTISKGIEYNPGTPATEEKLRLVSALLGSMQDMYTNELEEVAKRGWKNGEPEAEK